MEIAYCGAIVFKYPWLLSWGVSERETTLRTFRHPLSPTPSRGKAGLEMSRGVGLVDNKGGMRCHKFEQNMCHACVDGSAM